MRSAVAAVLVVGGAPAVSSAAEATHAIVVRGSASSLSVVRIPAGIRVDPFHASATASGRYAGFWLLAPVSNQPVTGVFYHSFYRRDPLARPSTIALSIPRRLRAATYTVAFFTDGPATLTLPAEGLAADIVVTAQSPLRTSYSTANPQPVQSSPVGQGTASVDMGPNDFVVLGMDVEGRLQQAAYGEMCLAYPGQAQCVPLMDSGGPWATESESPNVGGAGMQLFVFLYQRLEHIPTGRYEPYFRMVGAGPATKMSAFALTVDLPPANRA